MMKGLIFAFTGLVAVGCSGSDGTEEEEVGTTEQEIVTYSALSDQSTGNTTGFFIFSPWGTTTDATVFTGTPFAFATTRLKGEVVHLASCDPNGPAEDAGVFATIGVTVTSGNKFQISKNTASIGTGLVAGQCYRVKFKLDNFTMGFTDVQMVVGAAAATSPFHRLVTGSNFVVKFRTESSLNTDTDSDTVPDWRDNCPVNANTNQADTDNDGIGDVCDVADQDGDGVPDANDNCPTVSNANQANADGDSAGDACETCDNDANKLAPGTCGCGVADTDTDGDGTADCIDGCSTDPFKTGSGGCGCGNVDIDTNGDGSVDSCVTAAQRCL